MSSERPSVRELLSLLKETDRSLDDIIEIFVSIIQQKQMYGGDISDSIDYWVNIIRKGLHK